MTGDLAAFLAARLDEDEAAVSVFFGRDFGPSRPSREIDAKRAILAEHVSTEDLGAPIPAVCNRCTTDAIQIRFISPTECLPWPCPTVRALAAVYSDHPDYRQEWAPQE